MFFSYALGAIVLFFVLLGQARIGTVRRGFRPRLPVFLGVIGLAQTIAYAGDHRVPSSAWAWVAGTMLLGALGLGALRGLSMRVWSGNGWVVRQGTATTMVLWLLTLLAHVFGDAGGTHGGSADLAGATLLLYLGLTLGMQSYVVVRRGQPLWDALGPDAGRPLQFHFSEGPGAFFATFRTDGTAPPGWGAARPGPYDDPNVIDAEVVEDDDEHGPPELHAPR
jgi:hypothetical protein